MKLIDYEYCSDTALPSILQKLFPNDRLLFLDIETTGLSAEYTTLYLIGALWFDHGRLMLRQWLNETGQNEQDILTDFLQFSDAFNHLVHFNGSGFDIPYLKQKATLHSLDFHLDTDYAQTDLFRSVRPYRKLLATDSLKLSALAAYLGIERKDRHSGKELIRLYQKYAAKPDEETEKILLLHNHDDLLCLPSVARLLSLDTFFKDIPLTTAKMQIEPASFPASPDISSNSTDIPLIPIRQLAIRFTYDDVSSLPARLSLTRNGIYLNALGQEGLLICPIFHGTLKHFFPDYKNYYYLPKEDMAIHKSVAIYTEPQHRKKATRSTCYVRRECDFIPCPDPDYSEQFKQSDADLAGFQTLESLSEHPELLNSYIRHTLYHFV